MANFAPVPPDVLKHIPAHATAEAKEILARPGTYSLLKKDVYNLVLPIGNTTWKGPQARLVGVWGGDAKGGRLEVVARNPDKVKVTLVSEKPVASHLWAYLVEAKELVRRCPATYLEARTNTGASYSEPLPIDILPESASSENLGDFTGGNHDETRDAIIDECVRQGLSLRSQIAYVLATVQHETAGRFAAVREGCYMPDPRGERFRRGLRYYPYYGRGFVQLTWPKNYKAYSSRVGGDMVNDPDLALQPAVALFVLVHGMSHGTFGIAMTRYVNAHKTDFVGARRSVNGTDRAASIASLAQSWVKKLESLNKP